MILGFFFEVKKKKERTEDLSTSTCCLDFSGIDEHPLHHSRDLALRRMIAYFLMRSTTLENDTHLRWIHDVLDLTSISKNKILLL